MPRFISFVGLVAMLLLAWTLSENGRRMNWRLILCGLGLQWALGLLLLCTPPGQVAIDHAGNFVRLLVDWSDVGATFVFGETLVRDAPVACSVLPAILFVSSLTAALFHLGLLQRIVKLMARVMVWVMDVSGAESLAASANVFVGMTEAPLVVRPYLPTMTRSELMAMMTGGMATVAGGVMAAYAKMYDSAGANPGHLLAASIISAPASLVIAKIMVPETENSPTKGVVTVDVPRQDANVLDAACRGASDGLKLALNVAAMLIAFYAAIAMVNAALATIPAVGGEPLTLERILGWICAPLAWILGVEWADAGHVGMLLGKRTIMNEFLAYIDLVSLKDEISERSFIIATYALCGFANFASIAIQIGGIGGLVPSRRADFAKYGFRAMIGGTLAAYMTACIAGMLI